MIEGSNSHYHSLCRTWENEKVKRNINYRNICYDYYADRSAFLLYLDCFCLGMGDASQHENSRERPWLTGVILNTAHLYPALLLHLSPTGVLDTFTCPNTNNFTEQRTCTLFVPIQYNTTPKQQLTVLTWSDMLQSDIDRPYTPGSMKPARHENIFGGKVFFLPSRHRVPSGETTSIMRDGSTRG